MGANQYGLCHTSPQDQARIRCIIGDGGLPHQDADSSAYPQHSDCSGHCEDFCGFGGKKSWSAKSHCIRQGYKVHEYILAGGLQDYGDYAGNVIRLSSANGWADERANQSIEEMLRAYVGKRQTDWDERLGMVEFAYNNAVHSSTGFTPFFLCYGRHPVSPITILIQMETKNEAADSFPRQLAEDVDQAIQNLKKAQDRQKRYADQRRRDMEVQVGDEVLLSTKNLPVSVVVGGSRKLGPLYCGPFRVLEKLTVA